MALARRVTREASIYLAGFVAASVLQFLAVPIYTRYLGPERYSLYSLTVAVTTSLAGVLLIGGDVALSRFWFEARSVTQRRTLATSWILFLTAWSVLVVITAVVLTPAFAEWLRPGSDLGTLLIVSLWVLVPAQLSRMLAQILRNDFRPTAFAVTTVVVGTMAAGLGIAFAVGAGLGVIGILLGALFAELIGCLIRAPLVRRDLTGPVRLTVVGPLLRFGAPFIPASIAMWVFAGADRIAVGWYLDDRQLAGYSVAATLVAPFSVLLTALGQAWIPRVTQQYAVTPGQASRSTGLAIELSLILYGVAATILAVAAPLIIRIVAGQGYESGVEALPFLALGSVFLGSSLFTATGYTLAKRTALLPALTVAAAATDIVLLLVLVPRWGVVGASIAVCIGYVCLTAGSYAYSRRHFPTPVRWPLIVVVLASLLTASVAASVRPGSPGTTVLGVAVLAVLLGAGYVAAGRPSLSHFTRRAASVQQEGRSDPGGPE